MITFKKTFLLAMLIFSVMGCKNEKNKIEPHENKPVQEIESKKDLNIETGLTYAKMTKMQLGKNLVNAINKEGTVYALQFCNEKAFFLTDSMSSIHEAIIKRVSDKPRNPNNMASEKELEYIETFKKALSSNKRIEPIIEKRNDSAYFYYPIITNTLCLQCHGGIDKEIKPNVLKKIKALYPMDKAVGYSENQVRGIWSITMKNQENK